MIYGYGYTATRRTECAGLGFVAEAIDYFRRGANESNTSLLDLARELCVFREEAVARMDHVDAMFERDADDVILREIGPDGREAFANLIRFIGLQDWGVRSLIYL